MLHFGLKFSCLIYKLIIKSKTFYISSSKNVTFNPSKSLNIDEILCTEFLDALFSWSCYVFNKYSKGTRNYNILLCNVVYLEYDFDILLVIKCQMKSVNQQHIAVLKDIIN